MSSVAIVVPEMLPVPPVRGGAVEYWVHEASLRMRPAHERLAVVSRPAGAPGIEGIQYIGIPWTFAERRLHALKERSSRVNPLRHLAKIQNVWSYGRRVARVVRDFDVVYLHNEPNVLLFLKKRPGQKWILHLHNDHLTIKAFRPLYRRALKNVDVILCVSEYIRQRAVAAFPEAASRFKVVLNATNVDLFKPYGEEAWTRLEGAVALGRAHHNVLYVGRLTPIKGVHVLIQAFRDVYACDPQARLVIAGSSFFEGAATTSYERELIRLAEPIKQAILFTGYLPHTLLKYLYSACEVVAAPSVWPEPSGLVVLEAMSSGACIVGSRVGGIPDMVADGRTGILVPPDDAKALAAAISQLLSDPQRRQAMKQAARQAVVTDFSWDRLVNQIESVIGAMR
jgi:spore coat protein SA